MRNFLLALIAIIMFFGWTWFMFLSIDIVDGRDHHLRISPHFHASTDVESLMLSVFFMFVSFGIALFCVTIIREDEKSYTQEKLFKNNKIN